MRPITSKDFNLLFSLLALVIFLIFVGVTISGEDGLLRLLQLKKVTEEIHRTNRSILEQNLAYRQEMKSLNQLKTIEYHAHESLGLVAPNEVIYMVEN